MKEFRGDRIFKAITVVTVVIVATCCLLPFLYIIAVSFSNKNAVLRNEVLLWPVNFDLTAYQSIFRNQALMNSMWFTIIITIIYTVVSIIMTVLCAYPLSRPTLKFKSPLLLYVLFTMYFSGGMIPVYVNIKNLGLLDTAWALILPGCLSTYNMILMKSFFQSMPKEIEESASIDGANDLIILIRIVLPLSKAMLATIALFYAVGRWNGFMDSLLYVTNEHMYTIQVRLRQLIQSSQVTEFMEDIPENKEKVVAETIKAACLVFSMIPAPSPKYADGHYYVTEKLALMPIYALIESDRDQQVIIRLNVGRVCAWLNGKLVFDNRDFYSRKHERTYVFEHADKPNHETVSLPLKAGMNSLLILTGHVGRGTGIGISMELVNCEAPIIMHVPIRMDSGIREAIAHSKMETHLIDDCYRTGEIPTLHVGDFPDGKCKVSISLNRPEEELMRFDDIHGSNEINFPDTLMPGSYSVKVEWRLVNGMPIDDLALNFVIVEILKPDPGFERFSARRQIALERLAEQGDLLALYRLERFNEISGKKIAEMCNRIERRADCADFELLPLLWLAWEDRDAQKLGVDLLEKIKKAALGFRYWVDEPGTSSMFYCSENHRIGFHVCEYLAGLLYPIDLFTNCGQNGMYHSLKGRMHLMEWLNQRCRMGFDEPHSDSYLPVTLSAILVLREVLPREEYPLRNMVNILLDFMSFLFAVSSFDGIMATPRGRSYNIPLRTGLRSKIGGIFWLLFGNANTNRDLLPSELAFSYYVPPRGICELAYDQTPSTFTYKQGLMHFDKHNADFTIRRTPDYMIGGVRDHNVGMCDMHFISAMIVLKNDITIFFSAPNNVAEGSGLRPDYWAGEAFLPRVLMAKRTLAVIWHNVKDTDIWMTHCHFNARKFNEVTSSDGWTFGRSGDGYVGIYSSKPHSFRQEGPYAGRELISDGKESVWIAECGSRMEDGSFADFTKKILTAHCWQDNAGFHFDSPGSGLMEFGLSEGFTIDRKEVPISEYMVESSWLRSRYGSGRFDYTCPNYHITQWSYPARE